MATRTVYVTPDQIGPRNPNDARASVAVALTPDQIRDLYRGMCCEEARSTSDSIVDDLIARVESGHLTDHEALFDAVHEACDGAIVYTRDAVEYLWGSDNDDTARDEAADMGMRAPDDATLATLALIADVREELDARGYGYNGKAWDDSDDTDAEAPADATV